MSKKSAAAKGYRKSTAKKPYLSRKEIIITAVVATVVIIGLLALNAFTKSPALTVKNGVVQVSGENSLIVNTGTGYNPAYEKLGQLAGIEGYTLTSAPFGADENVREYTYTPDGESDIDSITVRTYALDAAVYAEAAADTYTSDSQTESEGLQTTEDDGHAVSYLTFRAYPSETTQPDDLLAEALGELDPENQELAELYETMYAGEGPVLVQALHGYVSVAPDRMVYMLIRNDVDSVEEYVDDSVFTDAMNQVLGALSYETR